MLHAEEKTAVMRYLNSVEETEGSQKKFWPGSVVIGIDLVNLKHEQS
jgi:hypothetical protein